MALCVSIAGSYCVLVLCFNVVSLRCVVCCIVREFRVLVVCSSSVVSCCVLVFFCMCTVCSYCDVVLWFNRVCLVVCVN